MPSTRCTNCGKFVSLVPGEPDIEKLKFNFDWKKGEGKALFDVYLPLECSECDTTIKEGVFTREFRFAHGCADASSGNDDFDMSSSDFDIAIEEVFEGKKTKTGKTSTKTKEKKYSISFISEPPCPRCEEYIQLLFEMKVSPIEFYDV
jgi:hypothetical protein